MFWPRPRGGGLADLQETKHITYYKYVDLKNSTYRNLRFRYFLVRQQLDNLGNQGAHQCFPGLWTIADLQADLVIREITVGLLPDAAMHLKKLEQQNKIIAIKLSRIRNMNRCQ